MIKAFVVHRGYMRAGAVRAADKVAKMIGVPLKSTVLRRSFFGDWTKKAAQKIEAAEVVFVYCAEQCVSSENASWEIEQAQKYAKHIFYLSDEGLPEAELDRIKSIYNFDKEFEKCFENVQGDNTALLEQYKIMVQSSEDLIQRRQLTNGFFTTLLSGLMAASGFVFKEGVVTGGQYLFFLLPTFAGLVLCRSWWRLIDNYGKLNRGKYRVIQKIETILGANMFAAEWYALGNDQRPNKYRSFTKTEGSVPILFALALLVVGVIALLANDWAVTKQFLSDLLR